MVIEHVVGEEGTAYLRFSHTVLSSDCIVANYIQKPIIIIICYMYRSFISGAVTCNVEHESNNNNA